jgi:hypothetical protein
MDKVVQITTLWDKESQ